jgi:hypothetical protein
LDEHTSLLHNLFITNLQYFYSKCQGVNFLSISKFYAWKKSEDIHGEIYRAEGIRYGYGNNFSS